MFGVVWDYHSSKLKGKQYKQNTSPKSYKVEIQILANVPWVSVIGLWTTRPKNLSLSSPGGPFLEAPGNYRAR